MSLAGKICLVTGASRGIGRGIALQLGAAGATVYITGRPAQNSDAASSGNLPTLQKTAQEITERGGKGIALFCDHSDMQNVKELFEQLEKEHNGQLDIVVNNAYSAVNAIFQGTGTKFFEQAPEVWDEVNNVGLRNHYYCCVYAARIMVKNQSGLIVNIGSAGALKYLFNIPYGAGKESLDRMSADMAHELKKDNVTVVSLWPGAVKTELVMNYANADEGKAMPKKTAAMFMEGETTEYPGLAIVHLASDPKMIEKSGRTLITADLGDEYKFTDVDGRHPPNLRSLSYMLHFSGWDGLARWVPAWVKLPGWVIIASCARL